MSGETEQDVGTGAASGAASGALMGSAMGPWGALAGGLIGGATGAMGGLGQSKARKAQQAAIQAQQDAIREDMTQRARGVGAVRAKFGDLSSYGQKFSGGSNFASPQDPSRFQNLGETVANHSALAGGIEQNASAVRDSARMGLTGDAQHGAAALRGQIAGKGLLGSSLDNSTKQMLLGQYAGGKANVAGATEGARQDAWGALKGQQNAFEGAANGGSNVQGQLSSLSAAGAIAGARAQQPIAAFGNLMNTGIGLTRLAGYSEAAGGQGAAAFGLPSMGLGGSSRGVSGASTNMGR